MRYTYDNSADNPRNPVQPPRRVFWGQRSADEMGDFWIQVLTHDERDLQVLNDRFRPKMVAEDIIGYERWLQSDPDSVALHDDVALLYMEANRPADAVRHFGVSAALTPGVAAAHFNLGTALSLAGRMEEATREFRIALQLKPDYSQAHNNLGSLLLQGGQTDQAVEHLMRALSIDPGNAQARYNAGVALGRQGRTADAIGHLRKALQSNTDSPAVLSELAWRLAIAREDALRDPAQAIRYAERAVELTRREAPAPLDVLAAAYASAGDFARAVDAAQAALKLAPQNAAEIRERLERYKQGRSYR
jgi:tetratricopeptide (TPR) repeat protein